MRVQSYLPLSKLKKLSKTHLFGVSCQSYKKPLSDHDVQIANLNCNKVPHPAMLVDNMLLAGISFDIHVKVSPAHDPAVLIQNK